MQIITKFIDIARLQCAEIALEMDDKTLSYRELNELSNQYAHFLMDNNIGVNDRVGICLKRSPNLIAIVIAVLKAGATYLPLDPEYPKDRLEYMGENSEASLIISENDYLNLFEATKSKLINIDNLDVSSYSKININKTHPDQIAYLIYTSGSTGKPKGVELGLAALDNLIEWQLKNTHTLKDNITLQFTPLSFDVHFQEIFSTLCMGGKLILINEQTRLNTEALINVLIKKKVKRIFLPYVALKHIAETANQLDLYPIDLTEMTTAGEQLKITKEMRTFFNKLKNPILHNHYGPSESHVVTALCLKGDSNLWPDLPNIGTEIENVAIYFLNEDLTEITPGQEGELYIGGACLAKGYFNNPEQTNERFFNHPRLGRIYKTGDLGIREPDQNIKYLGRNDSQVKIRGYRVELGEIEMALEKQVGVRASACKLGDNNGQAVICAYFTGEAKSKDLRDKLRIELPEYMVPPFFMNLERIPVTPSGKIDYKNLPQIDFTKRDLENEIVDASNETEADILKVWKDILKLNEIGTEDNFFDLGGNSLLAIKVLLELNQRINKKLSIVNLFQYPTIKELSHFLTVQTDELKLLFEKEKNKNKQENKNKDIAIISMTGRFPGAASVESFWNALVNVKDCLEIFPEHELNPEIKDELALDPNYVRVKGHFESFKNFDYKLFNMTPREAELMDPQQRKFLEIAYEALELAGYLPEKYEGAIGVFAGSGNSKYSKIVEQYPEKIEMLGEFNVMLGLEKDFLATRVAYKLNLKGPALSIYTACSTSLVAIIEAVNYLRDNKCDMAVAGGISISGLENVGHLFQEGGILSRDGRCTPFDNEATGTIFTDGAGAVVLKRLEDAIADGDTIYGVIKGVGINNDGAQKMSFTAPSVDGQAQAILKAQIDADIKGREIEFIEAHGTATPVGDPIEVEGLIKAFEVTDEKDEKQYCHLGSLKSNFGHLTGAAGVASLMKAVLSVRNNLIPAVAHFKKLNEHLDLSTTPFKVADKNYHYNNQRRIAGVSSFGVGGTNAHVIVENYEMPIYLREKNQERLFKLSAKTQKQLEKMEQALRDQLEKTPEEEWAPIAYTLEVGRRGYPFRSVHTFKAAEDLEKSKTRKYSAEASSKNELYFIYAGQGAFYAQMGIELYASNEIFKEYFDEYCLLYQKIKKENIKNIIFNINAEDLLKNTKYSQPAIFILQCALTQTLIKLGLKPDGLLGHSVGEFCVAVTAGIMSFDDALMAVVKRAELMSELPKGAMISVGQEQEKVRELIKDFNLDIAAVNGKKSVVVAGEFAEIDKLKAHLKSRDIVSIDLKTSHAFHSRMMTPIYEEYKSFLKTLTFNHSQINIISSVSGERITNEMTLISYWADHITRPVNFLAAAETLLAKKNIVTIEMSAKSVLSNLLKKEATRLKHDSFKAINLLGDAPFKENEFFTRALGAVWCTGIPFELADLIYKKQEKKRVPTVTYAFEESEVWLNSKKNKRLQNDKYINEEIKMSQGNEMLKNKLITILEDASGVDVGSYDHETSFLEMGMDSLFLTQISLVLKKEFKLEISFRDLMEKHSSVDLLANFLEERIPALVSPVKIETKVQEYISIPELPSAAAPVLRPTSVTTSAATAAPQSAPVMMNIMHPAPVSGTGLEAIIQRQLELMGMQLSMLAGQPMSALAHNAETAPIPAPAQAALETQTPVADVKTPVKKGLNNLKDAFGAQARISTDKNIENNFDNNKKVQKFFNHYVEMTKKSKEFTQKNRKNHADPRVVTGFKPEIKELIYPIVVNKSHMQTLWDLDGNSYIDMTCGFGSNFFGNGNPIIKKHVLNQIEEGIELGPQHPLVGEVSELINELTGNERTAFCNTGSEAVLGAMRIARTVTGRDKIICFNGSYHGINDEVILRGSKSGKVFPAAPGITSESVANMIVLDYGTNESLEIIRKMAHEIAAVLIEPVQSRRSDFHPKEFLKEVRAITLESDTCLIFDEIITGFRVHPAGAQGYFGIRADLCTYGKIVGGGMPIGVVSGKTKYMDALDGGHWSFGDDSTPTVGVTYFAGTFVRHPLALAAAKGALGILKAGGEKLLQDLSNRAQNFVDDLNKYLVIENVPLKMDNFGPLMKPKWKKEVFGAEILFAVLRMNGVHVYDGFPWFVTLAHTQEEIDTVLKAFKKSVVTMQELGIFPASKSIDLDPSVFDKSGAPMPGARIGKDENGNPAWFIEDPKNVGQYLLLKRS